MRSQQTQTDPIRRVYLRSEAKQIAAIREMCDQIENRLDNLEQLCKPKANL